MLAPKPQNPKTPKPLFKGYSVNVVSKLYGSNNKYIQFVFKMNQKKKGNWKYTISAFAGNCATLILYPLETVKTRFQGTSV